ncbi:hypothetical protein N7472_001435 [Penicillium cf. griseofulvum]|uniref:Uncharacterized protein n=1 Tax=Penicillium cf. griseofulvum TaxID=2972120 RepID=A0A9W9T6N7_9EURO|nr:hypothetical protein N7472_001435 [Penicillium cf. griseofulvum]KAJ5428847.1 hypothetical protein N7445_010301 [Penicillium cf. griseofulvum]
MTSTIPTLVIRAAESTGPITTMPMSSIFTAPASCSNSWTYEPEAANLVPNGLLIQNAVDKDNADPACFPSGYSQYGRVRPSIAYSPGYCPHGYTSADLVIHSPATTAICCPSDFSYYEEKRDLQTTFGGCLSVFPSSSSTIVTVRQADEESTQISGPVTMWAQAIQVQLQSSDKRLFVSATTTTTKTRISSDEPSDKTRTPTASEPSDTAASSTPSSIQTGIAAPETPETPVPAAPGTGVETSGLSTGAKIGVGVGVSAAGLIIIVALLFWFFRRRHAKGQKSLPETKPYAEVGELGGSTEVQSVSYQRPAHEGTPSELGGSSQAGESSIVNTRATGPSELHATSPGPKFVHELGA